METESERFIEIKNALRNTLTIICFLQLPEIDECFSSPCENDGLCIDQVNSYTCTCVDGYEGARCEIGMHTYSRYTCIYI